MKTETTFFSYSRADSEFVVKLAQDLRQGGAKVWLDQIDIGPGDRWDLSIEKALKDANRMLIVLSPDSVASHNVMDEVSFALEKGKQVIPILFKPCDVPFRLRRLQHIDFTKNYDKGIKKLLTELDTEANAAVQIENIDSNHLIDDTQDPEKTNTQKKKEENKAKTRVASVKKTDLLSKGSDEIHKETYRKSAKYKVPLIIAGSIAILAMVILGVINYPQAPNLEVQEWNTALEDNTINSYQAYQQNYPGGLYFSDAQKRIDEIQDNSDWETAISLETKEAYNKYLQLQPNGSRAEDAKQKLEDFDNIPEEKTVKAFETNTPANDENITSINLEIEAWNKAIKENTVNGYQSYQQKYPDGLHFKEAQNKIDIIEDKKSWQTALSLNTTAGYKKYRREHPDGEHFNDVQNKIDIIEDGKDWGTAISLNTKEGYEKYLQQHPTGLQKIAAVQKIADIVKTNDISGVYRIRIKADNLYLHEDGWGDKLVSTRAQEMDDFTRFIFERQFDNTYRIRVKADNLYLHEDGLGDKLVSTRAQETDDFTKFYVESQPDGSVKIKVKGSNRYWHVDGLADKLLSTRHQPNDDYTRFYLEKQ